MRRLRVLVADDHKTMLDFLVVALSNEFDVVAAVRDGASVVSEAQRTNPDLLVLDVGMPVMGGMAAACRLRASGSTAKVVFITMHHDREFVQESSMLGTVGFVVKDRLVSDLMPAIHSVLAGQPFVSCSVR